MARLTKEQVREAQIEKALALGKASTDSQPVAISADFDSKSKEVVIALESGAEYRFPSKLGQGLENASDAELSNITISPSGLGIHWPDIDAGLSIPHLLEGVYGTKGWMINAANKNTDSDVVIVRPAQYGLQYWKHNKELSAQVRKDISDANVLFVPLEDHQNRVGDSDEKVFAPDAEFFFEYLRNASNKGIKTDICVNDGEYRKLALYSDPITLTVLGTIVISSVVAPIIKDLILDYIRGRRSSTTNRDAELRINLIIDDNNGFIQEIVCSGSVAVIENTVPAIIDRILSQANETAPLKADSTQRVHPIASTQDNSDI